MEEWNKLLDSWSSSNHYLRVIRNVRNDSSHPTWLLFFLLLMWTPLVSIYFGTWGAEDQETSYQQKTGWREKNRWWETDWTEFMAFMNGNQSEFRTWRGGGERRQDLLQKGQFCVNENEVLTPKEEKEEWLPGVRKKKKNKRREWMKEEILTRKSNSMSDCITTAETKNTLQELFACFSSFILSRLHLFLFFKYSFLSPLLLCHSFTQQQIQ